MDVEGKFVGVQVTLSMTVSCGNKNESHHCIQFSSLSNFLLFHQNDNVMANLTVTGKTILQKFGRTLRYRLITAQTD